LPLPADALVVARAAYQAVVAARGPQDVLAGTVSEACEMAGLALIVEALLLHIALNRGSVTVVIGPAR
jgi:hypothetical protein